MAFRDAHGVVGSLVLYAEEKAKALDELSLEEFRAVSEIFDKDIYEEISLSTCINKRKTKGAPSPESVEEQIKEVEKILQTNT